ncbi:MAG: Methyltransferase domain-containing protein [Candidatus Nitrotoga sp. SPKER]|nr:MAG: Methyltransferase domain-containing protein [Candidatus Nitrotoga sp. SPKER]
MIMEVLQNKLQISKARQVLVSKGVSLVESPLRSLMRKLGLVRGVAMGDWVKSWDVLNTLNFLESNVKKNEPILDIGCYASEVIVALHKLGYSNLTGADLNPNLQKMPYKNDIHYEITDFMHTKFEDGSFRAITSISVIEHGFDGPSLLQEMARLLRPGGYFIASFDYWSEKIDTAGVKFFGMDWKIFSRNEVIDFVNKAANYGLFPNGEMNYVGYDKPIDCADKQYTFGWIVLKKLV